MQVSKAIVALHNFLMMSKAEKLKYCPPELVDFENNGQIRKGSWRDEVLNTALQKMKQTGSNNYSIVAKEYFVLNKVLFPGNGRLYIVHLTILMNSKINYEIIIYT